MRPAPRSRSTARAADAAASSCANRLEPRHAAGAKERREAAMLRVARGAEPRHAEGVLDARQDAVVVDRLRHAGAAANIVSRAQRRDAPAVRAAAASAVRAAL